MSRNGHQPRTAPRPAERARRPTASPATLEQEPAISVIRAGASTAHRRRDGGRRAPRARVLVGAERRRGASGALRELADAPLILAAYGEPNGIVETGLAVGAADVLVLPQPAETLLFAIRKAATCARPQTDDRQGRHRLLAQGRQRQDRARDEPRGRGCAASGMRDAARRPRPPVRRLGAHAGRRRRARRSPTSRASAGDIDAEKLEAFVSTDPRTGLVAAAGAATARGGRRRRPGGARGRARGGTQRLRRGRHRHRAALRRPDARRARPHRPAPARLQPRGDVAEERPHRARDDRPARLRPRARLARRQPARRHRRRSAATTSSTRSTRRSRSSCPTTRPCRPRSTGRCRSSLAKEREPASRAPSRARRPTVFAGSRAGGRAARPAPLPPARPTMSTHRPQRPLARHATRRCSPSASRSTGARSARAHADPHAELKSKIHRTCIARLGSAVPQPRGHATSSRGASATIVVEELNADEAPLSPSERAELEREIADDILGYGPLEPFLARPDRHRGDGQRLRPASTSSARASSRRRRVASSTTRTCCGSSTGSSRRSAAASTSRSPMVDARLPDGSRVNAIIPPLALSGPDADDPEVRARSRSRSTTSSGSARSREQTADFLAQCVRGQAQHPDLGRYRHRARRRS